jgi:hypothetical protein
MPVIINGSLGLGGNIEAGTIVPEDLSTGAPVWNTSGDVTLTGSIGIPAGKTFSLDAQSYIVLSGGQPILAFDVNDYITYDRLNNAYRVFISGLERATINSTGIAGDGSQLTNLNIPTTNLAAVYHGWESNNPISWNRYSFDPSGLLTNNGVTLSTNRAGRWLLQLSAIRNLPGTGNASIESYINVNGGLVSVVYSNADNYGYSTLINSYVTSSLGTGTLFSFGAAGAVNGGTSTVTITYLGP